jgi:hypothetical protein
LELKGGNMTEEKKEKPAPGKGKGKQKKEGKEAESDRVKIGVSIDKMLWRHLRAVAIMEDKQTGELLDKAIEDYLNNKEKI